MFKEARIFAIRKHGDQRYGPQPYIYHLDQVVECLKEFHYYDPHLLVSGYLHDTLEDTDTTLFELMSLFGEKVANHVWAVTGIGSSRAEKTVRTIDKLTHQFPTSIPLKMADRLCNMRFSKENSRGHIEQYRIELPQYKKLFKKCNPKMYKIMSQL